MSDHKNCCFCHQPTVVLCAVPLVHIKSSARGVMAWDQHPKVSLACIACLHIAPERSHVVDLTVPHPADRGE